MRRRPWAALLTAWAALVAAPASACELCEGHLPHRAGPFVLTLSMQKSRFAAGTPIRLRITIENRASHGLAVDLDSPVSQMALHVVSSQFKYAELDKRAARSGARTVPAGRSATFAVRSLQQWGLTLTRSGEYRANVSYDGVDSNVVTFRIG